MLRKRYYILFVARDEDGRIRKIPLPLRYAYGFVAAALVGAFTIVGLAGSYTRMLLKTESYNQVRQDNQNLRKDYKQMAQIAHDRDVQVASLGALASEVTALYGLRQNKMDSAKPAAAARAAAPTPATLALTDDVNQQQVKLSFDQFYSLRTQALSGRVTRALEGGLSATFAGDWTELADAPSIWPLEGRVTSSFGEREDPFNGEGAFHSGIDISAPYITHVQEDGFYGWPWFYYGGAAGGIQDPRHPGKHPELKSKVITPDILLNPHFASLEMLFYEGSQFPAECKGEGFAAEHGSWNRAQRGGYEVIRLPMKDGHATGEYEDFLTGFVLPDGTVWGRPVGVAQAKDGSLFVSDDGSRSIWHVSYTGK